MKKLITALDLHQWADKKESEGLMPELLRRLINASLSDITRLYFPTEDAVSLPGYDGILETTSTNAFVNSGVSVFEIGTDKNVKSKADSDYKKRDEQTSNTEKAKLNYVFVTPRKWSNARKWENINRKNSGWNSIRVITAIELEDWLSLCPSVSIWLATKIGLLHENANIESLEGFWDRWSVNADGMTLNYDILLGGREDNCAELIKTITTPNLITVVSGSMEESLAFVVASLLDNDDVAISDRCVIANDAQTIRNLITEYKGLIVICNCNERSFNYGVVRGNHSIVYVSSLVDLPHYDTVITLSSHNHYKFQKSLMKSGMTVTEARLAAKNCGRNVNVLRHQLGFDFTTPEWVRREDLIKVIPAMLLGRWNDDFEGDKYLLEQISRMSYTELSSILRAWLNIENSPFQRINNIWYVVSPYDTFLYIKEYITDSQIGLFSDVLKKALADIDPNALDKINPNLAIYTFGKRKYSGPLRDGLCMSLILFALLKENGQIQADKVVKDVFDNSNINWWLTYSSSDVVSYLAEASPMAFVDFVENETIKPDSVVRQLFVPVKKQIHYSDGYEVYYTQILFALNMLAWMPEYLTRISLILAELDRIPNKSNYSNRPFNSLMDIYRLWFPMTSVDADGRSRAITTVVKKHKQTGLRLCISLITGLYSQTVSYSSSVSRWRLKDIVRMGNGVSRSEINIVLKKISELIIQYSLPTADEAMKILHVATDNTIPVEKGELFCLMW